MNNNIKKTKNFKVVIIGKSAVGKSCLLIRFIDDRFDTNYLTTIGVDFQFKAFNIGDQRFRLDIWDTAGQERYSVYIFNVINKINYKRLLQKLFTKMLKVFLLCLMSLIEPHLLRQ